MVAGEEEEILTLERVIALPSRSSNQPPEIYESGNKHSFPMDFFAVGITVHEFVCGKRPFTAESIRNMDTATTMTCDATKAPEYEEVVMLTLPMAKNIHTNFEISNDLSDFIAQL